MNRMELEKTVRECISRVAEEQGIKLKSLESHLKVVDDLGFKSLDVATLTAFLENAFHVDPFSSNMASITEIRTIGDICDLYDRCLNGGAAGQASSEEDEADAARLRRRVANG